MMSMAISNIALPTGNAGTPGNAELGEGWIALKIASDRSGLSIRQLARNCGGIWFPAGLAKTMAPEGGGKPCWHIHVSADPAFALVKFPEQIKFDERNLSGEQRRILHQRQEALRLLDIALAAGTALGHTQSQTIEHFCNRMEAERGWKIRPSTLHLWRRQYRAEGLAGLASGNWMKSSRGAGPGEGDEFRETLKSYYLTRRELSIATCHAMAVLKAEENGWPIIGIRAAGLYLNKIPRAIRVKCREGNDAYTAKCEPSIARDYTALHSNEQFVGDHHQFDVICDAGGGVLCRPWITCWQEMRSRKIVGYCIYAHDPNSNSILSALRGAILTHGIPELLYVDRGKDFSSYIFFGSTKWQRRKGKVQLDVGHVAGVANHMGMRLRSCQPYHGQSKPIERTFRTMEARFCRAFDTYCGRSPLHKPEGLEDRIARGLAPKLEDFISHFDQWIETSYNNAPHRGQGMNGQSPAQVYDASWNGFSKRTTSEAMLDLLLKRQTKPLRVGKNGVNFSGLFYGQFDPALIPWLGREVYLRVDERDLGSVMVWSSDDKFITLAKSNQRIPANANHEMLGAAIAEKKRHRKLTRDFHQQRLHIAEDLPDRMNRAAAKQNADAAAARPCPVPEPPSFKPIRSALESQLPAVQRAKELALPRDPSNAEPRPRFEYVPSTNSSEFEDEASGTASTAEIMGTYTRRKEAVGE